MGVEEENGVAVRPVRGLPLEQLDRIQKDMIGLNNLIDPYFEPKISVEEVDGSSILVIWVPGGTKRPYAVPEDVTAKHKVWTHYIRYGTSSIEAKGENLEELRDLAKKEPFDERGNHDIKPEDISLLQIREYLRRVNSRLAEYAEQMDVMTLLEQMDLLAGPTERRSIKNVAAMMFCDRMEFFSKFPGLRLLCFRKVERLILII